MDYRLNNSKESVSLGDSWFRGVTAQIAKRCNVYVDIERAEGGEFTKNGHLAVVAIVIVGK